MRTTFAMLAAAVALGGCASSQAGSDTTEIIATGAIQYDGAFRPIQQSDGRLGMNTVQRIFGNVRVLYRESTGRSQIALTINTSSAVSEILSWAIVPGRCGSGGVPVMPAAQFPPIELSNNGRGDLKVDDVPIVLPLGTYHVNVYRGGENLTNVIACSNLAAKAG